MKTMNIKQVIAGTAAAMRSIWGAGAGKDMSAASTLPDVPLPQAKKGQTSIPSYRTQEARSDDLMRKTTRVTANTDATTFRTNSDVSQLIRNFAAANPDTAATINAYLRTGIPKRYTVVARDLDGRINSEATQDAHSILTRITYLSDPTLGYNPTTDLQSLSEALGKELLYEGAMAMELVLDENLMPVYPQAIAVSTLQFREDRAKGVYPVQVIGGAEIDLDLPTMFYVSADQDLLTAYADGFLAVSIRTVLNDEIFNNFLIRQLKRNIAPRMIAKVVEDKLKKSVSPDVLNSPDKLSAYVNSLIAGITEQLEDLEPEEAIVSTDAIEYDMKSATNNGGSGLAALLETVRNLLMDRVTASLKSLPAVLGRDTSSGSATVSAMLFLKSAEVITRKLNLIYSRMLTVAVRLRGHNCFVQFEYEDLDLRPKAEQEAYHQMRQSRVLDLLSVGFLTDEEACLELTGRLLPEGYTTLKSGTMFRGAGASQNPNPTTSQTSNMNGQKDDIKPSTPSKPKGNSK